MTAAEFKTLTDDLQRIALKFSTGDRGFHEAVHDPLMAVIRFLRARAAEFDARRAKEAS